MNIITLHDPTLQHLPRITHAFFSREGGVSAGDFASLNCGLSTRDTVAHILENRRRAMAYLGYPLSQLTSVKNVHGKKTVVVETPWLEAERPEADALVTRHPGIMLGSTSADCPIILFADPVAQVIGVAHAGWKGALAGVLESTLEAMVSIGADYANIFAALSPCIHQSSYEVDAAFYQNFLAENSENALFFKPAAQAGHYLFALPAYVQARLERFGLGSVSQACALNTYTDERFFSCRRNAHQKRPDFGGQLSCIMLKKP